MAYDINQVFLIGRLTRDPETRYSSNNVICKFSIANNSGRDEKDVSFFDIVTFGKTAEMCQQYLNKGRQVAIIGRLSQNRWEKDGQTRSKVEIIGSNIQFIGSKRDSNKDNSYSQNYQSKPSNNIDKKDTSDDIFEQSDEGYEDEAFEDSDEDIPF
jgi:single-strand DNA-binding protein